MALATPCGSVIPTIDECRGRSFVGGKEGLVEPGPDNERGRSL